MRAQWSCFALLALVLCALESTAAPDRRLRVRDDPPPPPPSSSPAPSAASSTPRPSDAPSSTAPPASSTPAPSGDHSASTTSGGPATSSISSLVATPSNTTNLTAAEDFVDPDALPLPPEITPALGVAGAILMLTGLPLAFIGIKNKYVQIFLSTGYLVALAITVLILYVMVPPISLAVQGAYFIGAFVPAVGLGGLSLVFKDVTEGLGCAVGGFALSMFFLVLKPGGLIASVAGKALFVGCWTVGAYALSFSHYTRSHALIGSTALGGSTALVLGIDCFSRAGLKEFWVFVWALNDKLFPLLLDTYPITRGMRVEIAGIVVFAFFGVLSQLKIWKVIQTKRRAREAERAEQNRQRDELEEALGQRIEVENKQGRRAWERAYGEGHEDSGIGTEDNSTWKDSNATSFDEAKTSRGAAVETIELDEIPSRPSASEAGKSKESLGSRALSNENMRPKSTLGDGLQLRGSFEDSMAQAFDFIGGHIETGTPRVTVTEAPAEASRKAPKVAAQDTPKEARKAEKKRKAPTTEPGPEVVPLPFKIPTAADVPDDDAASNATFASSKRDSKRYSQRLSGSHLRQAIANMSKRLSIHSSTSVEALVDDDKSLRTPTSEAFASEKGESAGSEDTDDDERDGRAALDDIRVAKKRQSESLLPRSALKQFDFELPGEQGLKVATDENSDKRDSAVARSPSRVKFEDELLETGSQQAGPTPSVHSRSNSKKSSASKKAGRVSQRNLEEMLPAPSASKVMLQYRTNEWAKHVTDAAAPAYDELAALAGPAADERATVVNKEELLQTPMDARPPPALVPSGPWSEPRSEARSVEEPPRAETAMAMTGAPVAEVEADDAPQPRSASSLSQYGKAGRASLGKDAHRASKRLHASGLRSSSTPLVAPIEEHAVATFPSAPPPPPPPDTLLAQRHALLQHKNLTGSTASLARVPSDASLASPHPQRSPSQNSSPGASTPDLLLRSAHDLPAQSNPAPGPAAYAAAPQSPAAAAPDDADDDAPLSRRKSYLERMRSTSNPSPAPSSAILPAAQQPAIVPTSTQHTNYPNPRPPSAAQQQQQQQPPVDPAQRRASMLAAWRSSIAADMAKARAPERAVQRGRAEHWGEQVRERVAREERRRRSSQGGWGGEGMGVVGKGREANEAHREVLRRMQAGANRALGETPRGL